MTAHTHCRRARAGTLVLFIAALVAIGCAVDGPAGRETNATPLPWTLAPPTARIGAGGASDSVLLTDIQNVLPVEDRFVYVRDSRTLAILQYGVDGELMRVIGTQGSGPGEFTSIQGVGLSGDTLLVADMRSRKRSAFSSDGSFLGAAPLPSRTSEREGFRSTQFVTSGFLATGMLARFITVENPPAGGPKAPYRGSTGMLVITDSTFAVRDTLTWLATAPGEFDLEIGATLHFVGRNHFIDTPLWDVAPDGSSIVVVERGVDAAAADTRYRVHKWGANGKPIFSVDIAYDPVAIPPALVDSIRRDYARVVERAFPSLAAAVEMVTDSFSVSAHFPPATGIVFGTDGSTWIARERLQPPPEIVRRYDVIDSSGSFVGIVSLDRPGIIAAATATAIWVVESDADDLPTLLRYPLVKR